jgi:chloramphenicol 3-O-phosphotransferase
MGSNARGSGVNEPGIVVVLDGPRCVGRTTTLAALQQAWPAVRSGPLLESGLGAALAAFGPGARRWRELVMPTAPAVSPGAYVGWGPLGRELVVGMHRSAAAWAHAGIDVVIDHVLLDHLTARDLQAALIGLTVLHVGLTCHPDVLEDRERAVHGSGIGTAAAQSAATRDVAVRDLVLDTTEATTEELVETILAAVERRI